VQAILSGQKLDENHWTVDGASECLVPVGRLGPFRTGMRSNAAVDRLTGATERHSTACIEFRRGSGLWTVVSFRDENAQQQWSDRVKAAFRLLADTGFGGERSRGWGRAEAPEFIEGTLPEMILPAIAKTPQPEPPPPVEEPPVEQPPVAEPPVQKPEPQEEEHTRSLPVAVPNEEASAAHDATRGDAEAPTMEAMTPGEPDPQLPPPDPDPQLPPAPEPPAPAPEPEPPEPSPAPEPPPAPEPDPAPEPSPVPGLIPEPAMSAEVVEPRPIMAAVNPNVQPPSPVESGPVFWLLSLFTPAAEDAVDWARGNYTVMARGGRVESPSGSGELKKQVQMVAEGSVLHSAGTLRGAAPDVAPEGFAHPVFRAGFALSIPLPGGEGGAG
jgi:hypothetical protein